MAKKSLIIFLLFAATVSFLSFAGFSLYNKTSGPTIASAQGEEPAVCDTEIPIGEALEKTLALYNDIFTQFNIVYQAVNLQTSTTQTVLKTAGACDTSVCSSQCVSDVVVNPFTGEVFPVCIAQNCTGEPCDKAALSLALGNIAGAVSSIRDAKTSLDQLTNVDGAALKEIRDLMKKSRRDFDACVPTARDIELMRGPTICGAALGNFWIEDCKSLLNFFCCR